MPPEFYAFGVTLENWRPWSPVDSIALAKYKSFYLSWNWMNDLAREALRQKHPDLGDMADEINPFMSEYLHDILTIVDDDDLKQFGQYSEVTLLEKYHADTELLKSASPALPPHVPGATLSRTVTKASQKKEQARTTVRATDDKPSQEAERLEAKRFEAEK